MIMANCLNFCLLYIKVDKEGNNVRKVQRSNDELQEQVENLTLQLEHLQSRYVDTCISISVFPYLCSIIVRYAENFDLRI